VAVGFPRPRAASALRIALVPAYQQCSAPNRTHGPPLGFASCNPPAQRSTHLTVGTPDANGSPAVSSGFVRHKVQVGVPGPPDDSDDKITLSLTDVRCGVVISTCAGASLSDYTGELEVIAEMRVTDRNNSAAPGGGSEAATVTDAPLAFTAPCVATAAAEGASCALSTSANALSPGLVRDGKRMLIELSDVRVLDGGADGQAATGPNTVFAVQGIFIP
jgi:hypothetical protein